MMKLDRAGLWMVVATLCAMAAVGVGSAQAELQERAQAQRSEGLLLSRSLAALTPEKLSASQGRNAFLDGLLSAQAEGDLAYVLWVSPDGQTQASATRPGVTPPPSALATEPAQWFSSQLRHDEQHLNDWLEFQAPVLRQDALAGFFRLGYAPPTLRWTALTSGTRLALTLPIALLMGVLLLLARREAKPLVQMQTALQAWAARLDLKGLPMPTGWQGAQAFAHHFQHSLQVCEQHFKGLEGKSLETLAMHRLLAYKKNRAEAVIHLFPDGVIVLDGEGLPALANAKIEPLLGVRPSNIYGHAPHEWCEQPEVLAFIQSQRLSHSRPQIRPAKVEIEVTGDTARSLELAGTPLVAPHDASQVYGTLITVRDTTRQRMAVAAGAEFVANVSHELKTPLNSLKAYSELLLDSGGDDEALRIEAVNVIAAEVDRMSSLINNLLNISKLETGAISLSTARVNVHDLLHSSFEAQRQSAVGQGLGFTIDAPLNLGMASLDKDLLRIALNNLLSNAIKYNRPGGEVVLSAVEVDDDTLEIRVRDTGVGMSAEHLPHIFDKHYRITGDSSRSGHGLGLYLARQIVELHHGTLQVQSQPGVGTEFILRLRKIPALYLEGAAA